MYTLCKTAFRNAVPFFTVLYSSQLLVTINGMGLVVMVPITITPPGGLFELQNGVKSYLQAYLSCIMAVDTAER